MRFFKEFDGFIFEFNSLGEYFQFLVGRILAVIIIIGAILLALWLI